MDYEKLTDLIEELGRLGRIGAQAFEDALRSGGRDGDTYVEEGFLQLQDVSIALGFIDSI